MVTEKVPSLGKNAKCLRSLKRDLRGKKYKGDRVAKSLQ